MPPATLGLVLLAAAIAAMVLGPRPTDVTAFAPPSATDAVDAGPPEIPWVWFSELPPDGGPGAMVVQAGVLGEDRQRVDVEVPFVVDRDRDIARMPAVAKAAGGAVVFVSDDGSTSMILRLPIQPGAKPVAVAEVDDTVWSIASMPDGSAAYIALVTRGRPDVDLGIFRVAIDGSGDVDPFLPPVASLMRDDGIRLAAIAPFSVTLDISADGRYLKRSTCRGPDGCTTSIIDIESGEVRELPAAVSVDLGTEGMIVVNECGAVDCATKAIDLGSGATLDVPGNVGDITVMAVDGRPVLVAIEANDLQSSVVLTEPGTGVRRELYRPPEGNWMTLGTHYASFSPLNGAVLVVESSDEGGRVRERLLLVPLDGGAPVELPMPPIRPIGPRGVQG
jgi:hypothetical protein